MPGGSTLITSAPKSDRMVVAAGPAIKLARSTTLSPVNRLSLGGTVMVFLVGFGDQTAAWLPGVVAASASAPSASNPDGVCSPARVSGSCGDHAAPLRTAALKGAQTLDQGAGLAHQIGKICVLQTRHFDRVIEQLGVLVPCQIVQFLGAVLVDRQADIPGHQFAHQFVRQEADLLAQRAIHLGVIALAGKAVAGIAPLFGEHAQFVLQQLQIIVADALAEGDDLAAQRAGDVAAYQARLQALLNAVGQEAGEAAYQAAGRRAYQLWPRDIHAAVSLCRWGRVGD